MKYWDNDEELKIERNAMFSRLEEAMSDASGRSMGGVGTEEQRYAWNQRELIRDVLGFMDRLEGTVDIRIVELETTIDEQENGIDDANGRLDAVLAHIKDLRSLGAIENIINHGREF